MRRWEDGKVEREQKHACKFSFPIGVVRGAVGGAHVVVVHLEVHLARQAVVPGLVHPLQVEDKDKSFVVQ